MSADALASYLAGWRAADPLRAAAWLFLKRGERIRYGTLAALQDEWTRTARAHREPQVAAAKLGWWREEMQRAAQGQARHPLTLALFAVAGMREIPSACWTAPVDALLLALAAPPPADFAAQLAAARPLAKALTELDARVWFGQACGGRAATATALAGLVAALRALRAEAGNGRTPLPMNLLARHGLTLEGLQADGPARRAALRDQAADLERESAQAATMPGRLTLFRAVCLQHDLHTLRQALGADEPLAALSTPEGGLRNLLETWRAARIWRALPDTENTP